MVTGRGIILRDWFAKADGGLVFRSFSLPEKDGGLTDGQNGSTVRP